MTVVELLLQKLVHLMLRKAWYVLSASLPWYANQLLCIFLDNLSKSHWFFLHFRQIRTFVTFCMRYHILSQFWYLFYLYYSQYTIVEWILGKRFEAVNHLIWFSLHLFGSNMHVIPLSLFLSFSFIYAPHLLIDFVG